MVELEAEHQGNPVRLLSCETMMIGTCVVFLKSSASH